jgi:predicted AAA+ superfamily ATPase
VWSYELIIIDEAQRVQDIWLSLKILHDNFPNTQIIATGSSSFELSNKINEPLTGRSKQYFLPPLTYQEIYPQAWLLTPSQREFHMLYGWYPRVIGMNSQDATEYITNIANNYLYKDILELESLKKSPKLVQLLQMLALQIGSEVSYQEIGQKIWLSSQVVQHYIDLLEKSFVVYTLWSYSRNVRNELTKSKKVYFWDVWVRNALIQWFQPMNSRTDTWSVWENLWISERAKQLTTNNLAYQHYFRRTYQQQEIDLIELIWDKMNAMEYKRNTNKSSKIPKTFTQAYPEAIISQAINPYTLISEYAKAT